MRRRLASQLDLWRKSPHRKPLILQGARQVGKTWLLESWGRSAFEDVAYFNFERDPALADLFERDLRPDRIVRELGLYRGKTIAAPQTLIILDEIQESEKALTSLKYFREMAPDYAIAGAGSLLGIKLGEGSFPVGQVDFLSLTPLSFLEFLEAIGKVELITLLQEYLPNGSAPKPFHDELTAQFLRYLWIGGMPEAVSRYLLNQDFKEVRQVQENILNAYLLDMAKHIENESVLKVRQVWESIPSQLAREKKKFQYSKVCRGARAKSHETALQWLIDAGLLLRSNLISQPGAPLSHYVEEGAFKLYPLDVGLLTAQLGIDAKSIVLGNALFTHSKGACVESFVAQELTAAGLRTLFYWTSGNDAEVDFLIERGGSIVPVEVKSGSNSRSKSLGVFRSRFAPQISVCLSPKPAASVRGLYEMPLYAAGLLDELLQRIPKT